MARRVWALLDEELVEHITVNQCSDAKEWLFFLIESLSHADFIKGCGHYLGHLVFSTQSSS
jgi:hypothetical protein